MKAAGEAAGRRIALAHLSLLTLVLLAGTAIAPLVTAASVQVDPAFGYRVGDMVVATARLAIDDAAQLEAESLPKTGRINGWLALRQVHLQSEAGALRVVRTFQVTASAPEPRLLFLPRVDLKFKLNGREVSERLDSVPISVSALTATEPVLRNGFGALRPDHDVPLPDTAGALRRAGWLAAALTGLALLWWTLRSYAVRRRGFAPFGLAAARLRRLSRRGSKDPDALRTAFRIMHEAFNETAGRAVFAAHREGFLADHARFSPESAAVLSFFERSNQVFFDVQSARGAGAVRPQRLVNGQAPADLGGLADMNALVDLAKRLARLERPGR